MDMKEQPHDEASLVPVHKVEGNEVETSEKPADKSRVESIGSGNDNGINTEPDSDEEEYVTGFKMVIVLVAVTAASFLMLLDTSIVATAIPRITSEFHSLPDIGWYPSAYLLSRLGDVFIHSSASLQPLAGKLYSRFNAKITFIAFLGLFEFGSLLCGVATSSKMLIVGRAVAGMGASGLMNGGLTIVALCTPLEKRPFYLGIMMGVIQLGIMLGPLVGGSLTEYTTWRWCFYINLPPGALVALFLFLIDIPVSKAQQGKKWTFRSTIDSLDLPGFVIFVPSAIMFLLALQWGGNSYRWDSATIIGLFCGAGATFLVFLGWEHRRGDTAMIPLGMIKRRVIYSSCLATFFLAANMLTLSYYMAIYFQAVRGVSPTLSGVYLLPSILSQMVLAILSGFLVGRLGYYLPWVAGGGAIGAVGTGLISTFTPTTATASWIGYQILAGAGRGCSIQMPLVAIQNNVKKEEMPVGMSVAIFFQTFGSAIGIAIAQTIFSTGLKNGLHTFTPTVDVQRIIDAGATGVRDLVGVPGGITPAVLSGVLMAYNQAFNNTIYLAAGALVAVFFASTGMGWKSVKKPKVVAPEA